MTQKKYIWSYGGFLKKGYPQIIYVSRIFPYKPPILGYPGTPIYGTPIWFRNTMSHLSISVGRLEADRGRGLPIRCEHRHLRGGSLHRRQEHLPAPWPWWKMLDITFFGGWIVTQLPKRSTGMFVEGIWANLSWEQMLGSHEWILEPCCAESQPDHVEHAESGSPQTQFSCNHSLYIAFYILYIYIYTVCMYFIYCMKDPVWKEQTYTSNLKRRAVRLDIYLICSW